MLVGATRGSRTARWLGWTLVVSVASLAVAVALLAPRFTSSTELVRMRNALLLRDVPVDFAWTPDAVPKDYKRELGPPHPAFAAVVRDLRLDALDSDWDRALAIGRHLLSSAGEHSGGPIQADLQTTYRRIVDNGQGYCGDFVDVFTGLALAAGIPVRAWAFSFDGFGGDGHVFNEVWDRGARAWRMIDVFNNYYFTRGDGPPLSALAFRDALEAEAADLRIHRVHPGAPVRFRIEAKAWSYYRRGTPEWYAWWGNNVFTYDRSPLVQALGPVSQSLAQLASIESGVHPGIRVVPTPGNAAQRKAMTGLRIHLLVVLALSIVASFVLVAYVAARRRGAP
jgi:hypothetical protein